MSDTYVTTTVNGVPHPTIIKDPDAVLDYTVEWADWLAEVSDSLATHTVTVPAGITCDSSSISGTTVIIWLSGGSDAETYQVVCQIVTTAGRTDDRSIFISMKER